jgi:hypothetical protein
MARLPIDFGDDDPQALADYTARLPVAPPNPGMTHYYIPGSIADYEAEEAAKANPLVFAPAITQSFSTANKLLSGEIPFAGPQEIYNRLTGANGQERYQTWPEQMVRSGFALPADVYSGRLPVMMGEHTNPELISRTQDLSGMAGGGSVAGGGVEATLASSGKMQRAYHGTSKPGFEKFNEPNSSEFMIDRALGVHVSKDPEIAGTFAIDRPGQRVESGAVYPVDIPHDAKFLEVEQPLLPYIEDKATPKNSRNVHSDQSQIEQLVMKTAFEKDPELLARYLVQARGVKSMAEALPLAKDMAAGKKVELPIDGKDYDIDRFVRNFGGRPYDRADSAKAVDIFKKEMQDKGYVGIKYINTSPMETATAKDPTSYILFNPREHIRNAITGQLMSDTSTNAPLSALAKTPVFYSAVEKAVKEAKQNTATGEQWLGYLRNQPGVKQEELDWVLHELPKGQISKADLEQFVNDHKVELKELQLGENDKGAAFSNPIDWFRPVVMEIKNLNDVALAKKHNANFRETFKDWPDSELFDKIQEYQKIPYTEFHDKPKHSQWQLPGGENYKEQLLTLPEHKSPAQIYRDELADKYEHLGGNFVDHATKAEQNKLYALMNKISENNYTSSHWSELNVLTHIRTNERTIPPVAGGRNQPLNSLHIEEIQSDWHQAGRKQGYKGEKEDLQPKFDKIEQKILDSNDESVMSKPELKDALAEAVQKKIITADEAKTYARYTQIESGSAVPDAPFKASWADLALKRVIAEAARQGKDSISWTPGEAQAARYDLSKHIDTLRYYPANDKYPMGNLIAQDKSGKTVFDRAAMAKDLPDIVGKEVGDKLLKSELESPGGTREHHLLEGADLKIGGEGMKGFYDKILVDKANAIAKKFGGKVEQSGIEGGKQKYEVTNYRDGSVQILDNAHEANQLANSDPAGIGVRIINDKQPIHVLRITPELRDAALNKGFALFADTGKVGAPLAALTKVEHNPFKLGELEKQHGVKLTPVESNPFTATAFHGSPNPIVGDRIRPMSGIKINQVGDKFEVKDIVGNRILKSDFATEEAAHNWVDKNKLADFYSTPNPRLAEDYATQNPFGKGKNITPLRLDIRDYHTVDARHQPWDAINQFAINEANQLGKKGVIVKNVYDDADPSRNSRGPQTVYITLDPSTVALVVLL